MGGLMKKNKKTLVTAAVYVLIFVIIYNLIDYFYTTVIAGSDFSFHWLTNILPPAIGGLIYFLLRMKLSSQSRPDPEKKQRSAKRSRRK